MVPCKGKCINIENHRKERRLILHLNTQDLMRLTLFILSHIIKVAGLELCVLLALTQNQDISEFSWFTDLE